MSEQAIPGDIRSTARGCICPKEAVANSGLTIARIERALLAERQKATTAERDRWMAYQISETDRLLNRVR